MKPVTFAYRGGNPLMRQFVDALRADGWQVDVREVPEGTSWTVYNDPAQLSGLTGPLEGLLVVTDRTLHKTVSQLVGQTINAYTALNAPGQSSIERHVQRVRPVAEEIRAAGRQPVVLVQWLRDHLNEEFATEGLEARLEAKETSLGRGCAGLATRFALLIEEEIGCPTIHLGEFRINYDGKPLGNVVTALGNKGLTPAEAILLVDHHVYNLNGERLKASGLMDVELVPICSCCLGLGANYLDRLIDHGFRLFSVEHREQREASIEKLKEMILAA